MKDQTMIGPWSTFFQGELGAAAALAGLLFVSMSVNQTKILACSAVSVGGLTRFPGIRAADS